MNKFDGKGKEFFEYIRTANGKQGIGMQEHIIEEFCKENNIKAKKYIDGGYSGLDINRPALKNMLKDIKESNSKNKVIIVSEAGRLFKDLKTARYILDNNEKNLDIYSIMKEKYINKNEIVFYSVQKYYDRPDIGEVLGKYQEDDIRVLLRKIIIDNKKEIIVPKIELYTSTEKEMIKELKEKWKSPYEIEKSERIAKHNKEVLTEDENMEF